MSLGINVTTSEGIVLAADSRQSYRNHKGMSRIGSESASKVFQLSKDKGLIVAGTAFLPSENGQRNISKFISDFKNGVKKEVDNKTVHEISTELKNYIENLDNYKSNLENAQKKATQELHQQGATNIKCEVKDGNMVCTFKDKNGVKGVAGLDQSIQFIVAGYNPDDSHQVCQVNLPGTIDVRRDSNKNNNEYGASWIGQTDVLTRLVLGFDPRIAGLPVIQKAIAEQGEKSLQEQLSGLEYLIQWGTMTLQDAVDFASVAIETTTAIQRFSDGIKGNPGEMPGVGGPIDVAVIRDGKFQWLQRKNLTIGDSVIELDTI